MSMNAKVLRVETELSAQNLHLTPGYQYMHIDAHVLMDLRTVCVNMVATLGLPITLRLS